MNKRNGASAKWRFGIVALIAFLLGIGLTLLLMSVKRNRAKNDLQRTINIIKENYVDKVDIDDLEESLIPHLLNNLDPHSTYLTREESEIDMQRLDGAFYGVGISFNTLIDTPVVVNVIMGGPAERAGLQNGDRIMAADGESLLDELSSEDIQKRLKGKRGSVVDLSILRSGKSLNIPVTRDEVPIQSIDVSYMVAPEVGLIRINGWSRSTYSEFITCVAKLLKENMKALVIDLRDNAGGYLEPAIEVANEFLAKGQMIVYNEGKAYPKEEYIANGRGMFPNLPLTILVNELSASSSEVFAAAMQDHDRATIIGRRTFGKGLVQRPFFLPDSSQIRLTIARYYTPSGRSIQKEYTMGDKDEYSRDLLDRMNAGEAYAVDSTLFSEAPQYTTDGGRVVYGGYGVMPDVFVAADSTHSNSYYLRLIESGLISEFAFRYADTNRKALSSLHSPQEIADYLRQKGTLIHSLASYAAKHGIQQRTVLLQEAAPQLERVLFAQIAQFILGTEGFYCIYYKDDTTIAAAIEVLKKQIEV